MNWEEIQVVAKESRAAQAVFDDMVASGDMFDFYGVDSECFKLGDMVLEAVKNESDGYRSCFGCLRVPPEGKVFFPSPIDRVRIVSRDRAQIHEHGKFPWTNIGFDGWELVAEDGHVWLRIGTDDAHDYYPCFHFEYTPRIARQEAKR